MDTSSRVGAGKDTVTSTMGVKVEEVKPHKSVIEKFHNTQQPEEATDSSSKTLLCTVNGKDGLVNNKRKSKCIETAGFRGQNEMGLDSMINSPTVTSRSAKMLKLSPISDDCEVVRDGHDKGKKGGNMKRSEKMLYLNPNTVAQALVTDPAKGRKLNYDELEDRMKTFKLPPQWEGPVDYQSMAEAGFVYTGQEDLVYCFSCNLKLDRWSKDMEPLLRHKEESPTCSFMRQKLQAVKKGKTKSVVAPSKPLNSRLTSSIGELQSSSLITSKAIHAVVTSLNEPRLSYGGSVDDRPGAFLPITPENYQSEAERIKSFVGWPLNEKVHPEQLARVGFVYTGDGALVQCFQCGVKYRHWYKGDVPLNVHQKCNPRCPFLQTLTSKSKSSPPEHQPTRSYIQSESIGSNIQVEEVSKHSLQHPDYSEEAVRLQSFKHWGGVLPAQELAEGGFYMIARRDVVRCFSCNVVVQDWERSDNVIDEHHRHSPDCCFLKQLLNNSMTPASLSSVGQPSVGSPIIIWNDNQYSKLRPFEEPYGVNLQPPPNMESGSFSASSGFEKITGIHYPNSWEQNKITPQEISSYGVPSYKSCGSNDVVFNSPVQCHNRSPATTKSQECFHHWGGCQEMEHISPPPYSYQLGMRQPNNVPVTAHLLSTPSPASHDYRLDVSLHSLEGEQISSYNATRTQSRSISADILWSSSDIKLPSSMKSRGSSNFPDDAQEEAIPGIRYPPSWGQHRSMSPQGTSKKILEGSSESFHSAESHYGADYNILSSIDPPKTKIMYEESLSEGLDNNISIKTSDSKGDDAGSPAMGLCQICHDKKIECIFLPCGHARTCEECATRIKNSGQPCPYCKKRVSTTYRIYL